MEIPPINSRTKELAFIKTVIDARYKNFINKLFAEKSIEKIKSNIKATTI